MTTLSSTDPTDARRREVVEAAAELLATQGPGGFTLRRVAAAVGGSTQIVYSLFGGKPGLADALYAEGFARLAATDAARGAVGGPTEPGDPARMLRHGLAYCDFARSNTALFSVMFGRAVPGFVPREQTLHASRASTLGRVTQTAQECLDAGTLRARDAESLARVCWATAHGVASLIVAGHIPGDDATTTELLLVPITAHRPRPRVDRDGSTGRA